MNTKKRLRDIRDYVFAKNENLPLEHRIFLSAIIVGILVSTLGGTINFILLTSQISVIIPLILSVCLITIYYFVRFKKIVKPFITPIIIVAILGISAIWVFNGGIPYLLLLTLETHIWRLSGLLRTCGCRNSLNLSIN